jgi:hypothetical protein
VSTTSLEFPWGAALCARARESRRTMRVRELSRRVVFVGAERSKWCASKGSLTTVEAGCHRLPCNQIATAVPGTMAGSTQNA